MRVSILLRVTDDDGTASLAEEITAFEKRTERPGHLGLFLAKGKTLTAAVQRRVVKAQAASWAQRRRCCEAFGAGRPCAALPRPGARLRSETQAPAVRGAILAQAGRFLPAPEEDGRRARAPGPLPARLARHVLH